MRMIKSIIIISIIICGWYTVSISETIKNEGLMLELVKEVAIKFNYYDEISKSASNKYKGKSEIGGQCGDYALAFVNLWNSKNNSKALLIIQQQGIKEFPDGIYEVVGKDNQDLPFLKDRTTSMLYIWNNVLGIGHPQLGGYKIKLVKKAHVVNHFGKKDWKNNGPHVWVKIDDISVDPTYADLGVTPIIGHDTYQ